MSKLFNKRTILGSLFFLIMVGEPAVGGVNGLYTIPGFISLFALYTILFLLYEALIVRYELTYGKLLPLTFGIYSVVVTGLLHGEIAHYITRPQDHFVTTLIRIQCSFYPIFAYYLLNKFTKRDPKNVPKIRNALLAGLIYILVLTPSGQFGLETLGDTFRTASGLSLVFTVLGIVAIVLALRPRTSSSKLRGSKVLDIFSWSLFLLCLIPTLQTFFVVLIFMPIIGLLYLRIPDFRNARA